MPFSAHTNQDGRELVVVANRLPVSRVSRKGERRWERSAGGLVSALSPLLLGRQCTWIGWNGLAGSDEVPPDDQDISYAAVPITAAERKRFYEGFSNRLIWPLYHDALREPEFVSEWWETYHDVNHRFATIAADIAAPNATVWIHDYHLQCMPRMLRELRPDVRIGFFLHIPFPPQELFMQLPWRTQILEGMLGADLVGFQTRVGAENFRALVRRVLGMEAKDGKIPLPSHDTHFGAFPISVDYAHITALVQSPAVQRQINRLRRRVGTNRKILLGVDRLDYTKGVDVRLRAFEDLLRSGAVKPDECVFVQVAVPTRERLPDYQELRREVERAVGEINGGFGDIGQVPVHYLYRNIPMEELIALYACADVMVVTPLRDGMNLVAKEYVAARSDPSGVLVLSEFTGAAHELREALIVNPHHRQDLSQALGRALSMSPSEQACRMRALQRQVRTHDIYHWASTFWHALHDERIDAPAFPGAGVT